MWCVKDEWYSLWRNSKCDDVGKSCAIRAAIGKYDDLGQFLIWFSTCKKRAHVLLNILNTSHPDSKLRWINVGQHLVNAYIISPLLVQLSMLSGQMATMNANMVAGEHVTIALFHEVISKVLTIITSIYLRFVPECTV